VQIIGEQNPLLVAKEKKTVNEIVANRKNDFARKANFKKCQ